MIRLREDASPDAARTFGRSVRDALALLENAEAALVAVRTRHDDYALFVMPKPDLFANLSALDPATQLACELRRDAHGSRLVIGGAAAIAAMKVVLT